MSKEEIKRKLYKLIDGIDDEKILHRLEEDIVPYVMYSKSGTKNEKDELTAEQEKKLQEAYLQVQGGDYVTYEEFKKRMSQWLTE